MKSKKGISTNFRTLCIIIEQSAHQNFIYLWYIVCSIPYMKHLYLLIFFLFTSLSYGQQTRGDGAIDGFKLYPNPVTNGKVYISTTHNAPKKILIYDVLGTQVLETTILGKELNLSNLDAGVYVIRVFEQNLVATRKLIIK